MADTTSMGRPHPIIIIAAIAVILTCLVAVAAMTGILPSAKRTATPDVATAPAPDTTRSANPALPPSASLAPAPSTRTPLTTARAGATERAPAVGSTSTAPGGGAVSGGTHTAAAPVAPPPCTNCGTVVAVRAIKQQGDASMIGPAAGALLGGVLGNQIGSGSGNKIATVVGAGAGAAAGTEIERRYKSTTSYVIDVRMNDGSVRHFSSPTAPAVQAGSRVRVVDGKLLMA